MLSTENIQKSIDAFTEDWYTGYEYTLENIHTFVGESLSDQRLRSIGIYIMYIKYLYSQADATDIDSIKYLDEDIKKQLLHWNNDKKGLCIYLSIVLYYLLRKYTEVNKSEITFCQGSYWAKVTDEDFILNNMQLEVSGLHAWLEVEGAIIDLSILQIDQVFDFKAKVVLGELPEGLVLQGWKETHECAKKYAKDMAKECNLKLREWHSKHIYLTKYVAIQQIIDEQHQRKAK